MNMGVWILTAVLAWPGMATLSDEAEFKTKQECFEALEKAKCIIPNASENEWACKMICLPKAGKR